MADVAATLEEWAATRDLSGSFLVTRAGETVLEQQVGYADEAHRLPHTPATRFAVASVTKMFTACTVAGLVGQGRLGYDDPVVDLVAAERRPSTLRDDVTVHHLLTHTSGIADYCEEDEDYPNYLEDYGSLWADRPSYSMQRPLDFLPLYGDLPPYEPPGGEWHYSNAGFVLLAQVVEDVTGEVFTDVVQREVFDAAGMTASGFLRLDEAHPDVAVGYLPRESEDAPRRSNVYSVGVLGGGDGGSLHTARDLDRFLTAYADGSLLGDQTEVVQRRHVEAGNGFGSGYGLLHYPDGRWGHGGGDPGVDVLVNAWPTEAFHVVVLCNREEGAVEVRDLLVAEYR